MIKQLPDDVKGLGMDLYLEEIDGYISAFKNQGLFPRSNFPFKGVDLYKNLLSPFGISTPSYPQKNWLYKIPRRW